MKIEIITESFNHTIAGFGTKANDKDYANVAFRLSGLVWEVVRSKGLKTRGKKSATSLQAESSVNQSSLNHNHIPMETKPIEIVENLPYLQVYFATLVAGLFITLALMRSLRAGLARFFGALFANDEVTGFFSRLTLAILFFCGLAGELNGHYARERASAVTVVWDAADQLRETASNLFAVMIFLIASFFLLYLLDKKLK